MIERGEEPDGALEQHGVAEHVAGHVADARDRERGRADIDVDLAEMPPHRLPGAARRDPHFLVVVAGGAARGERIAEPEFTLDRDAVGDIRKGRRAFVGRDHEVGIVAVVAHHVRRRDDALGPEIVGDIEQARDEQHVGRGAFLLHGFARAADGEPFRQEPALGADRHDHRVLDLLRLGEAEDLGAEILRPVRPADAAARHLSEPQMHAFEPRRIHEDLVERPRCRHLLDLAALELDGDGRFRLARALELIEIGAHGRHDRVDEAAQDAILVEALDALQRALDSGLDLGLAARALVRGNHEPRVEARVEQLNDLRGDACVLAQGRPQVILRIGDADLAQEARDRPHQGDVAPRHAGGEHQRVVAVVLGARAHHREEARLEPLLERFEFDGAAVGALEQHVVQPDWLAAFISHHALLRMPVAIALLRPHAYHTLSWGSRNDLCFPLPLRNP